MEVEVNNKNNESNKTTTNEAKKERQRKERKREREWSDQEHHVTQPHSLRHIFSLDPLSQSLGGEWLR